MVTEDIRGAVYIQARAYHSWQMWNHYAEERREWPEWCRVIKEQILDRR